VPGNVASSAVLYGRIVIYGIVLAGTACSSVICVCKNISCCRMCQNC